MIQRIQLALPKLAVSLDPFRRVPHRLRDQTAAMHASFFVSSHKSRFFQNPQMLGNRGERNVVWRGELAYGNVAES